MKRLDYNEKLKLDYCIPLWLRDEQVKLALRHPIGRIQPGAKRTDRIAIVGYGPSLKDTFEEIRNFQYVISCSGSHRFLIDRGIIPTWHVAVDPLPKHTVRLIGEPHPEVKYLISSTCHPDVFAHLKGFNVELWHVFSTEEEVQRLLPAGEWAVMGGMDAGMRAMTIARFFGFTDQHIFGLDGSYADGKRHAGDHPVPGGQCVTEYGGKDYYTNPAMLGAAKQVFHELDMMPDVNPTFYGEGLIQAMSKNYVRKFIPGGLAIAQAKPELISKEYRALNKQLHEDNLAFGVGGGKHAATVIELAEKLSTRSILDYGCGKGYLAKAIPFPIWEYDPAVPGKEEPPRPADLVICTDVLEHIEPDKLGPVLADLRRCLKKLGYFIIHTGASSKSLPDGRNAHLIQKDREWWAGELGKHFKVAKIIQSGLLLHVIVVPGRSKSKRKVPMSVIAAEYPEMEVVQDVVVADD